MCAWTDGGERRKGEIKDLRSGRGRTKDLRSGRGRICGTWTSRPEPPMEMFSWGEFTSGDVFHPRHFPSYFPARPLGFGASPERRSRGRAEGGRERRARTPAPRRARRLPRAEAGRALKKTPPRRRQTRKHKAPRGGLRLAARTRAAGRARMDGATHTVLACCMPLPLGCSMTGSLG